MNSKSIPLRSPRLPRRTFQPFRLQPPRASQRPPLHVPYSASGFKVFTNLFGLRHSLAGSPIAPGRIEFVILRTGRSLSIALHIASRRRSYVQLLAWFRRPEEDLHLLGSARSRAHECCASGIAFNHFGRTPAARNSFLGWSRAR